MLHQIVYQLYMLVKNLIQKGNIQNLTNIILNPLREKKNQFFLIWTIMIYTLQRKKLFLMQEMGHGIKDGKTQGKCNAIQHNY